jgi:hypothetical protein
MAEYRQISVRVDEDFLKLIAWRRKQDDEAGSPLMHARIAMLKALSHGKPAAVVPRQKRAKAYKIVLYPFVDVRSWG